VSNNSGEFGGGIYSFQATTTLTNSTVSGNTAGASGGGIYNISATLNLSSVTVTNNRLTNTSCTFCSGGIFNNGSSNLNNTIVAGNTAANASSSPDFTGGVSSTSSFNIIGNNQGTTGITGGTRNNQVGTPASPIDPRLEPLADNGGPTQTHALLADSPAIDKGSSFGLTTDQRGLTRPVDLANYTNAADGADIGAFEVQNTVVAAGFEGDVSPRRNGDGGVQSNDVVQVRRFQNGTDTPSTSSNEFQRADSAPFSTKGDGCIRSDDVVQTRRYQNGTTPPEPASGPTAPGSCATSMAAEEQSAVAEPQNHQRQLRVESTSGSAGSQVTVNIRVDSVGNEAEYGFILNYDPNVLSMPVILAGDAGASVRSCNIGTAGQINCSVGGFPNNQAGSSDGGIGEIAPGDNVILIRVTFTIAATAQPGRTPLTLSNVNASSDAPMLFFPTAVNGTVTILAPTATTVSISGRVTAKRRGVSGAVVQITKQTGEIQTARTNRFGYYTFKELAVGETYIFNVFSKRFQFNTSGD